MEYNSELFMYVCMYQYVYVYPFVTGPIDLTDFPSPYWLDV
jgi:hypothetical protein